MIKQRTYKFIFIATIAFLLQSCFVAKNYERPELDIETEKLFRTENLSADSTSLADISWEDFFLDETLKIHIREALDNNQDIRIALQQIVAAEAYLKQGRAGYFPTLSATARVTHQQLASNSQFGSFFDGSIQQYELLGNLSWEADIWGKIRSNKRAFEARYLQSVAAHQAVKTNLIANVATMYYTLLALDEQLKITQKTIENRKKTIETTAALKESGNVTSVGVKQTEAQLYTAQAIELDLKMNIAIMENAFSILLGKAPQFIERSSLEDQQISSSLETGVPALLLRNRPDVIAAEFDLISAFELTNVARTNFYPSLTITGSGGLQSIDFAQWFDTGSLFANIVGGLTQPIFNGRRIRTQYEVAQSEQEQAVLNFEKALLNAGREVSDALYSYHANSEKTEIRQKEFEAYNKAREDSELLLENGFANYLEVLTAQEQTLNTELNLIDSRLDQLTSIVELYTALGGGWK